MSSKNLVFLINLHHPYIKLDKDKFSKYEEEGALFFRAISRLYLPLLNMLSKFEKERIAAKFALIFSASICALLDDEEVKCGYNEWLDSLIEFAKKEVVRTKKNLRMNSVARKNLDDALKCKRDFNDVYGCDLLGAFSNFAKKEFVEILATCGTYMFVPHFCDMGEILNAQVESGLYAVKTCFGRNPAGFFLPEMGYAPEIENVLKLYGVEYTVLPRHSFLFSKIPPRSGIFAPAKFQNSLDAFASVKFDAKIAENPLYRDTKDDLSWELSHEELFPFVRDGGSRHATTFSYKKNGGDLYDDAAASALAKCDACDFVEAKTALLSEAQEALDGERVFIGTYFDGVSLSRSWAEFFEFLECSVREAFSRDVKVVSFSDLIENEGAKERQKIIPYLAAYSGSRYGENLVSSANNWMMRYLRKSSERLVDLVSRFPDDGGLKARLLNLGARELMLAQDCTLAKMVDSNAYANFASECFRRGIVSFSNAYEALGKNTVSTEWFCSLEKAHSIFPWMNYRIFAKKH